MSKKTNVYLFGLGEKVPNRVTQMIDDLKTMKKVNVVLGPSKEDHEYLLKNIKYYKKSFDKKRFSFCGDVGKAGVFTKYGPGIYLDSAAAVFTDRFEKFIDETKKYENVFVKETKYCIAADLLKITDLRVANGVVNFYKNRPGTRRIGPNVITRYVRKYVGKSNDGEENKGANYGGIKINEIDKNGKTGYFKAGLGASGRHGVSQKRLDVNKDQLVVSGFVQRHSKGFDNKGYDSKGFAFGVGLKKLTRNY